MGCVRVLDSNVFKVNGSLWPEIWMFEMYKGNGDGWQWRMVDLAFREL